MTNLSTIDNRCNYINVSRNKISWPV